MSDTLVIGAIGLGALYLMSKNLQAGATTQPATTKAPPPAPTGNSQTTGTSPDPHPSGGTGIVPYSPNVAQEAYNNTPIGGTSYNTPYGGYVAYSPRPVDRLHGPAADFTGSLIHAGSGIASFGTITIDPQGQGQTYLLGNPLFTRSEQVHFGEWEIPGYPNREVPTGTPGAIWVAGTRNIEHRGSLNWLGL